MTLSAHSTWRRDRWALLLAMVFPTFAAWVYFVALDGNPHMKTGYAVTKLLQFGLPAVWVWRVQRRRFGFTRADRRALGTGFAIGLAMSAAIIVTYLGFFKSNPRFLEAPLRLGAKLQDIGATTPLTYLAMSVFLATIHSGLEEYYWRWFVFAELARRWPVGLAIGVSSLAFMGHHLVLINTFLGPGHFWTWTMLFSLGIAVGGGIWAWLYQRAGDLCGIWLSHFLVDAAIMWTGYDLVGLS